MTDCPFCNVQCKFTHTYFEDVKETPCEAWIDYEKERSGRLSWYAVLNGDQYTTGHTLVILGSHRDQIIDPSATETELAALATGLRRVSSRLKNILNAEAIHVLSLCEGVKNLHFHLIPRYRYTLQERNSYIENYWGREVAFSYGQKRWLSKDNFQKEAFKESAPIHGMWYTAYHEMNFNRSDFYKNTPEERAKVLERLARRLREPNLRYPFER